MSTVKEIQAAIPTLSREEIEQIRRDALGEYRRGDKPVDFGGPPQDTTKAAADTAADSALASARTVLVSLDPRGRPVTMPSHLREHLAKQP